MKTQITHLKLARYPELLEGPLRPMHWDVDPSSVCDHRCKGCPYIFDGPVDPMLGVARPESAPNRRTFLRPETFAIFLGAAKWRGAKAITFVGGGEPTMHPRFEEMMRWTHEMGLKYGVVTHLGRTYSERFFEQLAKATWIRVSVNAGHRETYEAVQGRDHFARMLLNTKHAVNAGARVGWSFLISRRNHHEIVKATSLAKIAGCAYIQFKPLIETNLGEDVRGLETHIMDRLVRASLLQEANGSFLVLDQWSNRLEELRAHERGAFKGACHVTRFNPKLGANGVVYTCCELAYSEEGAIGNIYDEDLDDILERARTKVMEQSRCPHCWDKRVNTMINEGRFGDCTPPPESVDQEFL